MTCRTITLNGEKVIVCSRHRRKKPKRPAKPPPAPKAKQMWLPLWKVP